MKIGIISYQYTIEISPFIKNLSTYLGDENNSVLIFIDKLNRSSNFNLSHKNIHIKEIFKNIVTYEKYLSIFYRIIRKINKILFLNHKNIDYEEIKRNIFAKRIKTKLKYLDIIFAVDFFNIDIIKKTENNFNNVIALILEDHIKFFKKEYVIELLSSCRLILFPSNDRKEIFSNILGYNFSNTECLPVSIREKHIIKKEINNSKTVNLLYSGYFAEWACVHEIINMFNKAKNDFMNLTLHGHAIGTDNYLNEAQNLSKENKYIFFDNSFYEDENYYSFLSNYDIGLAIYKDINNDGLFSNILFSSGKIASYLSSGLAIITNLENEITLKPPFLLIKNYSIIDFINNIEYYLNNKQIFIDAAYELSNKFYNFDNYMINILPKLIQI